MVKDEADKLKKLRKIRKFFGVLTLVCMISYATGPLFGVSQGAIAPIIGTILAKMFGFNTGVMATTIISVVSGFLPVYLIIWFVLNNKISKLEKSPA